MKISSLDNKKRLIKNTSFLYFRMLFLMAIGLYSSRIVLRELGVSDFGIYNVVGGVVAFFGMISGALSAAVSRYLNVEMGKSNSLAKLREIFSSAIVIHFVLAVCIVIVAEVVGPWFIENKMVIPNDRIFASKIVFHVSLATFFVNLVSIPYNACVIAHEKMNVFAYVSVLEGTLKLISVCSLAYVTKDKLIVYGILMFSIAVIIRLIYQFFCTRNYQESRFSLCCRKSIICEMFGFVGWNTIGSISVVLSDQGVNILLNVFCSPIVNAARGIAVQVSSSINQLVLNFMTALNPQIMKKYGEEDYGAYKSLVWNGARFSAFLLLILSIPFLLETRYILRIWLGQVPDYSVNFVRLSLLLCVSESFANTLVTAIMATGKIKWVQILVGGARLLNFPLSFILLKYVGAPEYVYVIAIAISQVNIITRIVLLKRHIPVSVVDFYKCNVLPHLLSASVSLYSTYILFHDWNADFKRFFLVCLFSMALYSILSVVFVVKGSEKKALFLYLKEKRWRK